MPIRCPNCGKIHFHPFSYIKRICVYHFGHFLKR